MSKKWILTEPTLPASPKRKRLVKRNDSIVWMYRAGESQQQIADAFGISRQRVNQVLSSFGLKGETYRSKFYHLKKKIAQLSKQGLSMREISKRLNVSLSVVQSGTRRYPP